MAYASSIKRAQVIRLCELCEENNIKWICIECDQSICDKCKTIHLRARGTRNHNVVTITTFKDVEFKIITDNIPCKDHKTKIMCLFCKTCDCLVCQECVTTHNEHNFILIDSALDEKFDKLKGFRSDINDEIIVCESNSSEIGRFTSKYNSLHKDSATNIIKREQNLIEAISKYSKDLQDDLKVEKLKVENTVSKTVKEISQSKENLEKQRDQVDAVLTSNQGRIIFEARVKLPELKLHQLPNTGPHFIPGRNIPGNVQKLFGSLPKVAISTNQQDSKFEIQRTYETEMEGIKQIIALDETSAWIVGSNVLRKVKITDRNFATLHEFILHTSDIAPTNNDDILITLSDESSLIEKLTKSGEKKLFFAVAPMIPKGIHVTKNNNVMVGVREPGDPYQPTDHRQRAVIVFDMHGDEKRRYQYDRNTQRLFTNPMRITTNTNQDILVIDHTSLETGRVVCLDRKGNLEWVYEGHSEINATSAFYPQGIITTSAGHIIVSDYRTHALHVLSVKGEVLIFQVIKDLGIEYPWGLDIDKRGQLLVGCGGDGKLHILKLRNE